MPDWSGINSELQKAGVHPHSGSAPQPVAGGDISAAWRVDAKDGDLFIKTGPSTAIDMFAAEAEGLSEIAATGAIRTPKVIALGESEATAFLALEWLNLDRASAATDSLCGQQLAELHRHSKTRHGWHRSNTIGLTPQINSWNDNWVDFFREHRLHYQLRLAADNGFNRELQMVGARLMKRMPVYFDTTEIDASLLHGDLWSGNRSSTDGVPVIFDPAAYYGDRETDLAMTKLFGGFGAEFYAAYDSAWPLREGHEERQHLYQLYHVLNHLNLFGSAYLGQAMRLIEKLL